MSPRSCALPQLALGYGHLGRGNLSVESTNTQSSFFARLKQHHIYRVAVGYGTAIAVGIQVVARAFPYFGWAAAVPAVIIILIAGFPLAIVLAWLLVKPANLAQQTVWQQRHWKLGAIVIPVVIAAVVISGIYAFKFNERHEARIVAEQVAQQVAAQAKTVTPVAVSAIPAKSIAVLPFDNLNVDKKNAYFVAGMQDLILAKLADIGDLKVISRTSTEHYGSHPENLTIVAQQLGVATLLEGSVQKAGNQVLITVQLIDAKTDAHIWAQSYQRTLENVFGVEGEVAEQIATALNTKLSATETQRLATALSSDPVANDLYLHAEYFANQGNINYATAAWKQAIALYRQAIAKVPDFALARARLSYNESQLAWFGGGGENVQQLRADARTQAEQALALAPELAEAYLALGSSDYWGRGDYAGALTAFTAALKVRPNDADALAATGYVLRRQGRFEAAIVALQQALAHDPRNSALAFELAATTMMVSRYAEAEVEFQHALALDPTNARARLQYSNTILFASGDIARALAAAQGDAPQLQVQRVNLLTYQRKYQEALALLATIPDTPDNFSASAGSKALQQADLYRLVGDAARAKPLFEQALPLARAQVKAQTGSDIVESQVWVNVADAELGLGHTSAGLAAIAKSQALMSKSGDHLYGPGVMTSNANLYAEAGRPDRAVPLIAMALASPGNGLNYSPVLLWLDPAWDPIRKDPRFQALLNKYSSDKPQIHSGG
ncbi:MAG: tetratricopeptide repeat protein [Gammaproteobacteria bacterium]